MDTLTQRKKVIILIVLAIGLVFIFRNKFVSQSPAPSAELTFKTDSQTLAPDTIVKVFADAKDSKIGFVQTTIHFDSSKVKVKEDITINKAFETEIKKSTPEEANSTGTIVITIGLRPGDAPLTGSFEIASIPFTQAAQNAETTIDFVIAESQIVDIEAHPLALQGKDLKLSTK